MTLRTTTLAAVCAAGLLTVPAAAGAAAPTVVAGPYAVEDYDMTVVGTQGSPGLSVMLTRTAGDAVQSHIYSFAAGATVKVKGAKASIKADLGAYGAIALKTKKLGKAKRGVLPAGCTGSAGKSRSGTLSGSLRAGRRHDVLPDDHDEEAQGAGAQGRQARVRRDPGRDAHRAPGDGHGEPPDARGDAHVHRHQGRRRRREPAGRCAWTTRPRPRPPRSCT